MIKPNPPAKVPILIAVNERKLTFAAGSPRARGEAFFQGQRMSVLALDLLNLPICKRTGWAASSRA